jgi:hypothetical protein
MHASHIHGLWPVGATAPMAPRFSYSESIFSNLAAVRVVVAFWVQ